MADDLSPEQELVLAMLALIHGPEEAGRVVRADRVTAYMVGAELLPRVPPLIERLESIAATFSAALDKALAELDD